MRGNYQVRFCGGRGAAMLFSPTQHYRGLGGIAFIGKPKQPTLSVAQLAGEEYTLQQYRLGQLIRSPLLPHLQLRLDDILPR